MTDRQLLYARLAFLLALTAMLGSLYFSEIAGYPPCKLCWFQRLAVFPSAILLAVGLLRKDGLLHTYILPLTIPALIISLYHNLLYYQVFPESAATCEAGISCTTKFIEWFGFVTIPLLAFLALLGLTILMYVFRKEGRKA
jgi:disulfide bond formation protein DsbB